MSLTASTVQQEKPTLWCLPTSQTGKSRQNSSRLENILTRIFAFTLLVVLAIQPASAQAPGTNVCPGACVQGICNEPGTPVGNVEGPAVAGYVWRQVGGQWCLFEILVWERWVWKRYCTGSGVFRVRLVVGWNEINIGCVSTAPDPATMPPTVMNPWIPGQTPPSLGPPGTVPTGAFTNCYSNVTGLGPGAEGPSDTPPPGSEPTGPATGPGPGFWDPSGLSIVRNPCFRAVDCPASPADPPDGTVVVVWEAPTKGGTGADAGQPDTGKAKPVHAAKSNGNGTYDTKNGTAPRNPAATRQEAVDRYTQGLPTGRKAYTVCYEPIPDCPAE